MPSAFCAALPLSRDPPIRIVTKLAQDGIHYRAREEVLVLERSPKGATLRKEELPDEVDFEQRPPG